MNVYMKHLYVVRQSHIVYKQIAHVQGEDQIRHLLKFEAML
jgi:hypothetical protein